MNTGTSTLSMNCASSHQHATAEPPQFSARGVKHLSMNTTGMSTTWSKNCTTKTSLYDHRDVHTRRKHLRHQHDLRNRDVEHLINGLQLGKLYVF